MQWVGLDGTHWQIEVAILAAWERGRQTWLDIPPPPYLLMRRVNMIWQSHILGACDDQWFWDGLYDWIFLMPQHLKKSPLSLIHWQANRLMVKFEPRSDLKCPNLMQIKYWSCAVASERGVSWSSPQLGGQSLVRPGMVSTWFALLLQCCWPTCYPLDLQGVFFTRPPPEKLKYGKPS